MRSVVAPLLALALLAGCLQEAPSQDPVVQDDSNAPPVGVTASQGNGTASLPLEFQAGFRVDDVHLGVDGPEPNVGVTSSGAVFATALGTVMRSTNGGLSYEAVYSMTVGSTSDPMLWVDTDTDRIFSHQMFPTLACSSYIASDDDGATWTELPAASCGLPVVDHQKVASGPAPAGAVFPTTPAYPNLVTYCYNKLTATQCAVSVDGGVHFIHDAIVGMSNSVPSVDTTVTNCGGLNGHQHHARDGTIYVPYGFNCGQAFIGVSTDGGFSYQVQDLHIGNIGLDPEVTSTPDGTAYMFTKAPDGKVYVVRSKDHFASFDGPFLVSPPGVETTAFLGMTAGSDGRLAFGYLGTTDPAAIEDDVNATSEWNAYVTMTLDAGAEQPTFVTVQVNQEGDPVQRGSICQLRGCVDGNRNLLDFVDLHAGPDGRFYFAYADGCTTAKCVGPDGTDADSRSAELVVARLAIGPSLVASQPAFTA